MVIKTRRMARDNWSRIVEREFTHAPFVCDDLRGELGLIRFGKVSEPLKVMVCEKLTSIVENGYYWLQIAPEGKNWWLTAMFDTEFNPLEYYIDVTLENIVDGKDSYFRDLFLDIIVSPSGDTRLVDEDELAEALDAGIITEKQYKFAYTVARELLAAFPARIVQLERFCADAVKRLASI